MSDQSPSISVIMPAFNHETYVAQAIESVLYQTWTDWQLVIINDGSTDQTAQICRAFADQHKQIKYIDQPNAGAHQAINTAIVHSTGDYLAVLNSDDMFYPEKLLRCMNLISERPGIQWIAGEAGLIDEAGNALNEGIAWNWMQRARAFYAQTQNMPLSVLNENFVATTSNMVFSRQLWLETGGFQPLRYCHDLDFMLSALRWGKCFFDQGNPHIHYRVHTGNTIQENIERARVEIAAVTATSLVLDREQLMPKSVDDNIDLLAEFFRNKNASSLVAYLMMRFLETGDRHRFYQKLYESRCVDGLITLLD